MLKIGLAVVTVAAIAAAAYLSPIRPFETTLSPECEAIVENVTAAVWARQRNQDSISYVYLAAMGGTIGPLTGFNIYKAVKDMPIESNLIDQILAVKESRRIVIVSCSSREE